MKTGTRLLYRRPVVILSEAKDLKLMKRMYNGFHSHLPIRHGDDIFLILGLHTTAMHDVKYAFDVMRYAPGIEFTPIALPLFCKADECFAASEIARDKNVEAIEKFFAKDIAEIFSMCISGNTSDLDAIASLKLGLQPKEYKVCVTVDHRFVYDEIAAMRSSWDWETSYQLTLQHSDLTPGPETTKLRDAFLQMLEISNNLPEGQAKEQLLELIENDKYYYIELDRIFMKHTREHGKATSEVTNLNPKHIGTYLYRSNEAYRGELLLAIYRHHADIFFHPELKSLLLGFLNFHQVLRRHGWMLTLPVFAGQEENLEELARFYHRLGKMVEKNLDT